MSAINIDFTNIKSVTDISELSDIESSDSCLVPNSNSLTDSSCVKIYKICKGLCILTIYGSLVTFLIFVLFLFVALLF